MASAAPDAGALPSTAHAVTCGLVLASSVVLARKAAQWYDHARPPRPDEVPKPVYTGESAAWANAYESFISAARAAEIPSPMAYALPSPDGTATVAHEEAWTKRSQVDANLSTLVAQPDDGTPLLRCSLGGKGRLVVQRRAVH